MYSKRKSVPYMVKTSELFGLMDSVIIDTDVDYREILDNAIAFKYGGYSNKYVYREKELGAIMVNQIRHCYTNYNSLVGKSSRIHRSNNDYGQFKNSVLDKISKSYPLLKDDCNRQKISNNMVKIIH